MFVLQSKDALVVTKIGREEKDRELDEEKTQNKSEVKNHCNLNHPFVLFGTPRLSTSKYEIFR